MLEAARRLEAAGVVNLLATAVGRDGMATGPDLETLQGALRLQQEAEDHGIRRNQELAATSSRYNGEGQLQRSSGGRSTTAAIDLGDAKALLGGTRKMTLAKRIVPCLDVKAGRVVKGVKFEGLRDAGDPVELSSRYRDEGADEVVFLDITASLEKRATMRSLVRSVAASLDIPFTVGGGIRTMSDARLALASGADKVAVNTAALRQPGTHHEARRRLRLPVRRRSD